MIRSELDIIPEISLPHIALDPVLFNGTSPHIYPPPEGFVPMFPIEPEAFSRRGVFGTFGRSVSRIMIPTLALGLLAHPKTPQIIANGLEKDVSRRDLFGFGGLLFGASLIHLPIAGDPSAGPEPETIDLTSTPASPTNIPPTHVPPSSTPEATPISTTTPITPEATPKPHAIEILRNEQFPNCVTLNKFEVQNGASDYWIQQLPPGAVRLPEDVKAEYCIDINYTIRPQGKARVGVKNPFDITVSVPHGRFALTGNYATDEQGKSLYTYNVSNLIDPFTPGQPSKNVWVTSTNSVSTCTKFNRLSNATETYLLFKNEDGTTTEYVIPQTITNTDTGYRIDPDEVRFGIGNAPFCDIEVEVGFRFKDGEGADFNDHTPPEGTQKIMDRGVVKGVSGYHLMALLSAPEAPDDYRTFLADIEYTEALSKIPLIDLRMHVSPADPSWQDTIGNSKWTHPVTVRIVPTLEWAKNAKKNVIMHSGNFGKLLPIFKNAENGLELARESYFQNIGNAIELLHGSSSDSQDNILMIHDMEDYVIGKSAEHGLHQAFEAIGEGGVIAQGIKFAQDEWEDINSHKQTRDEKKKPPKVGFRTDLMFGSSDPKTTNDARIAMVNNQLVECSKLGLSNIALNIGGIINTRNISQSVNGTTPNSLNNTLSRLNLPKFSDYPEGETPLVGHLHLDLVLDFAPGQSDEKLIAETTLAVESLLTKFDLASNVTFGFRHLRETKALNSPIAQQLLAT